MKREKSGKKIGKHCKHPKPFLISLDDGKFCLGISSNSLREQKT
jgi:hypothetical protein